MATFDSAHTNLVNLFVLSDAVSRSISPENFDGEKGKGGMATDGLGKQYSANLGRGWKISPAVMIDSGKTFTLADINGPGSIQSMWLTGYVGRDFILRIYWDEQESPSVQCPLSDFFAVGWVDNDNPERNGPFSQLSSLPVTVNPNLGLNCFWPMPFHRKCRMTLENISEKEHWVFYQINYTLTELPENIAYFHAQFRRTNPVPYKGVHTILDGVSGKGQYVGTNMSVGLNGKNYWWGEGEIKFFLDGDAEFPTICGTGTEDYFGGAFDWIVDGRYTTYSTPFMGMHQAILPDGAFISQPRFSMYRWHIADPIRFHEDIRITIQDLGTPRNGRGFIPRQDDISSVAYWYQTLPTANFPDFYDREYLDI